MNPVMGLLLLGAVAAVAWRPALGRPIAPHLLILFGVVFTFFTLISPSDQERLDTVSWQWVDVTMFPSVILASACLAAASVRWRLLLWSGAIAAMVFAVVRMTA
jgi:hypothetical protein